MLLIIIVVFALETILTVIEMVNLNALQSQIRESMGFFLEFDIFLAIYRFFSGVLGSTLVISSIALGYCSLVRGNKRQYLVKNAKIMRISVFISTIYIAITALIYLLIPVFAYGLSRHSDTPYDVNIRFILINLFVFITLLVLSIISLRKANKIVKMNTLD